MSRARQVAGGGRLVEVEPERLVGWVTRFADRHGGVVAAGASAEQVTLTAGDGAVAILAAPFGPLLPAAGAEPLEALLAHIAALGDLGLILVRERAYSVGVAAAGVVTASSTDTRYVQSRTAAGGWSQQRYARRRGNQRRDSYRAAADTAYRVLGEHGAPLAGLVVGGDRTAVDEVLADPRLARYAALPRRSFPDIAEPRRAVLDEIARRACCVEITIVDATTGM